jgi:hypothetical protein
MTSNICTALCTAFVEFLHIGEFTWPTWNNQSFLQSLSRESIQFVRDGVILQLPASKTGPFRKGMSIPLSPLGKIICPVSALRTFVKPYPRPATSPLFSRLIGPFDRKWVLGKLRQALLFAGVNAAGFSGHSFRRGAANSPLKAGISREGIMKMGRWKCDSVDRYFSRFACIRVSATQSLKLGILLLREHQASPMSCYCSRAKCSINLQVIVNRFS